MRVFYFDEENGIFQGQGYEDGHIAPDTPGMTTIPPPPHEQGMVPVFVRGEGRWVQRQNGMNGSYGAQREWRCRIIRPSG
jgi:hypothetical protein